MDPTEKSVEISDGDGVIQKRKIEKLTTCSLVMAIISTLLQIICILLSVYLKLAYFEVVVIVNISFASVILLAVTLLRIKKDCHWNGNFQVRTKGGNQDISFFSLIIHAGNNCKYCIHSSGYNFKHATVLFWIDLR